VTSEAASPDAVSNDTSSNGSSSNEVAGISGRSFARSLGAVMQPGGYGMSVTQQLDATFAALADPTRRAILARLALGEASVLELAEPFEMTQPAVSKHLKVLERAGLVSRGRDAQRRPRRLEARPLAEATQWLENYRQFWEGRFQHLDALLDEMKDIQGKSNGPKR
jgi:DNA-binding transcriptional ArsR family regulator